MFWKTVAHIYKKIAPEKFETMNKDMNDESLRILNKSILLIKKGISLKEEKIVELLLVKFSSNWGMLKI